MKFLVRWTYVVHGVAEIEAEDAADAQAMFRTLDLSNEVLNGEFRVRGVKMVRR